MRAQRSLARNDNGLIEARALRKLPAHVAAAAAIKELRDLIPPCRAVFTFKLADLQRSFVVDNVLDEAVVLSDPVPGLEEDALTVPGLWT